MNALVFEGCNAHFSAPNGMVEEQVATINAYVGRIRGGNLDGTEIVVVAYQPSEAERADIMAGKPIFLTCLHALPPHFLSTDIKQAKYENG